jgi:hypothetical protein
VATFQRGPQSIHDLGRSSVSDMEEVGEVEVGRPFGLKNLYRQGDLAIHLHWHIARPFKHEFHDGRAVLKRAVPVTNGHSSVDVGLVVCPSAAGWHYSGDVDDLVLVDDVQFVDQPKGMLSVINVRTTVWLQLLDDGVNLGRDSPELFGGSGSEPFAISGDRIFGELVGDPVIGEDKLPDRVIEDRSKMVHDFTDHQAPTVGDRPGETYLGLLRSAYRVRLDNDSVVIELRKETAIRAFERVDLVIRVRQPAVDEFEASGHHLPLLGVPAPRHRSDL